MPNLPPSELDRFVTQTEGFSIAYLRELVVLTQCFGKPFEEAIERLKKMRKSQPESTAPGRGEFGFAGRSVQ
jgi:hypothetical protein